MEMLLFFIFGAILGTAMCRVFLGKAIMFTAIPLAITGATFLHADLTTEKNMVERKPSGH